MHYDNNVNGNKESIFFQIMRDKPSQLLKRVLILLLMVDSNSCLKTQLCVQQLDEEILSC